MPIFEMERLAGGSVKATLRIPVKSHSRNKYVEYSRNFYGENEADPHHNIGGMSEFDFAGFVMPLVRFTQEEDAIYTVSCISTYSRNYSLKFFEGDQQLPDIMMDCRNVNRAANYKAENYTIEKRNFDHIEVSDAEGNKGVIVPVFQEQQSVNSFDFAIDLGTSNTHIEYRVTMPPLRKLSRTSRLGSPIASSSLPRCFSSTGASCKTTCWPSSHSWNAISCRWPLPP